LTKEEGVARCDYAAQSARRLAIKIQAKFWIEFEVEDTSNPRHTLKRALARAERD
jgi:hypothetical protein